MCGLEYCETCTPTVAIVAWQSGRTHATPMFGDYAQSVVSRRKRAECYREMKRIDPPAAMEFPEFVQEHHTGFASYIDFLTSRFDRLCAHVPEFGQYVAAHPYMQSSTCGTGRRMRKRRQKLRRSWKRERVSNFFRVERHGQATVLRHMLLTSGVKIPPWLQQSLVPVDMPLAAAA